MGGHLERAGVEVQTDQTGNVLGRRSTLPQGPPGYLRPERRYPSQWATWTPPVPGWIRPVKARAEWLRVRGTITGPQLRPDAARDRPSRLPVADAVSALGAAAAAMVRRISLPAPPWQVATIAGGQLLAPLRSG